MLGDSREPIPSAMSTADLLEAILGISEGPIKGLKDGVKSFYFGETPVVANDGSSNFDSFELKSYLGNEVGEPIQSLIGGFGSTVGVGVALEQDIPVVRSGVTQNIDYLDVRINLSALYRTTDRGNRLRHQGSIKLEYRRTGTSAWSPVTQLVNLAGRKLDLSGSSYDIPVITGTTIPNDSTRLFLKTDANYAPYIGGRAANPAVVRVWRTVRAPFTKDTAKNHPQQYRVWVHATTNAIKLFNGAEWVAPGSSKNVAADLPATDFSTITGGIVPILGKTYSDLMLEYRIPVAKVDGTYDLRVTKLGGHDNNKKQFVVSWESIGEISAKAFNFPGLAVTQIAARSTDQLSSIPEMSGIYEGRLIRVPSNYDPVARTYTGTWNGAWKIAYSNNPAFVGYDLVMNDRYGMNAYYPVNLNKWDVYEAGQWCDVRAVDGTPRFTFNGLITDRMGCREAVNYIFGILGARFFDDGNGQAVLKIDKTNNPVAVFAPENVIDGVFNYSFAGISTQYNDITVQFTNPNLNWQTDQRRVYDQDHIDKYGRISKSITAVGCTSEGEAIRRGKYHLVTSLSEKTSVSFKTNRQGLFVQPYDLILIADPYLNFGWSGRVGARTSASVFSFRDPVFLEAGFNYQVSFLVPTVDQGLQTFTMPLVTGQAGASKTSLTVVGTLPAEVGPDTQFSIGAVGDTNAAPKTFRVMSVTVDGDGDNDDNITIEAVEHNRVKWDYVDGLIDTIPVDKTGDDRNVAPLPVGNFEVVADFVNGQMVLVLKWTRSPSRGVSHYVLKSSVDGDPFRELGTTSGTSFNIHNLPGGDYLFSIVPVNNRGMEGPVRYAHFEAEGDDTTLPLIENLVATAQVGVTKDGIFQANLRATWSPVNVNGVIYDVIYSRVGEDIPRRFETRTNSFVSGMVAGNSVYNLLVSARVGNIELRSPTLAQVSVPGDDTIPGVPTGWGAFGELRQIVLSGDRSSEPDFKEFIIYASERELGPFVEVAAIPSNYFIYPTNKRIWFKVAQRDRSNNLSPQTAAFSAEPISLPGIDDTPPATPTGFVLTSEPGKLIATWNANTEDDLAYYDVEVTQDGGNPVSFQTSSTRYEWPGVLPNIKFTGRVRAVDQVGWRSPWTALVEHTTARDTVPPAVPTGLAIKAGFNSLVVNWNRNTESDLSHYEVYQSELTTAPATATVATYSITSNTLMVNDLGEGKTYHFWVRAVDTSGNKSAWSARAQGTTVSVWLWPDGAGVPTGLTVTSTFANGSSTLNIGWTAPVNATLYEIGIIEGTGNEIIASTPGTTHSMRVLPGVVYKVRVRALNKALQRSNWTAVITHTATKNTVAPAVPTGLKATGSFGAITLQWARNTEVDFSHYEIAIGTATDPTTVADRTAASMAIISGLADNATRFARIRAVNTSGLASAWTASVSATTAVLPDPVLTTDKLRGLIDATSFGAGVQPITIWTGVALPATRQTDTISWQGKLYRWDTVNSRYVADVLANNAVQAAHLDAGVVTAQKMAIGFGGNFIPNSNFVIGTTGWALAQADAAGAETTMKVHGPGTWAGPDYPTLNIQQAGVSLTGYADLRHFGVKDASGALGWGWPVKVDEWLEVSVQLSTHRCTAQLRIEWRDEAGTVLGYSLASVQGPSAGSSTNPDSWPRIWIKGKAPTGAAYGLLHLRKLPTASGTTSNVFVHKPMLTSSAEHRSEPTPYAPGSFTLIDGNSILTDTIKARAIDVSSLTTEIAKIDTAFIKDAHIVELSAATLKAGTALAGTITVNGQPLGTIKNQAEDPAGRINQANTQIDPGKIRITGTKTLADWRKGGDETRIDGGEISANTIRANALEIGSRNLTLTGVQFEHNTPGNNQVWWSAGYVRWVSDAGNIVTTPLRNADSVPLTNRTWSSGVLYIYFAKPAVGQETTATDLKTTTSLATAMAVDNVCLATYEGGVKLDADYGRTIIDGSTIKTGTIRASQLVQTEALITRSAQIDGAVITNAHITGKLDANILEAGTALAGTITVNGDALGTVKDRAANPAPQINANSTLIDPGKIRVTGTTTLADWRKGGDETRIDGGMLSANTVKANALEIGSRNITLRGIQFDFDKTTNVVSWSAGSVAWINDDGNPQITNITAGSYTWTGGVAYIVWTKGGTSFWTTTSNAMAFQSSVVILATYEGGTKLDADYGRTIIDGSTIRTGTITASQLIKTAALITDSAQIGNAVVGSAQINNLAVNTLKLAGNAATAIVTAESAAKVASGSYINAISVTIGVPAGQGPFGVVVFVSGIMSDTGGHQIAIGGSVVDSVNIANFSRYTTMQAHGSVDTGSSAIAYQVNSTMKGPAKMTVLVFKR